MHNFRRLTLALMLAAFAAVAAIGAVAWADTGDHPGRGMHAVGKITKLPPDSSPNSFVIQPLMERAGAPDRTFAVDDKTKYFIYDNTSAGFGDLKTGMRVEVDAHRVNGSNNTETWVADAVRVVPPAPAAMGRVTAVYPTTTTFTLRWEDHTASVTTDSHTIFRVPQSSNTPPTFADIKVGDWVSVWAKPQPAAQDNEHPTPVTINPAYVVQVIRRAPPPPPPPSMRLFNEDGKIADLNKDGKTFNLVTSDRVASAPVAVKWDDKTVVLPDGTELKNGLKVRVVGTRSGTDPVNARIIVVEHEND